MIPIIVLASLALLLGFLLRSNFLVLDGHVLWWQVQPILDRGIIRNEREFRAALYFVEQTFESGGFDRPEELRRIEQLNLLLADYQARFEQARQQ